jgi:homoserine kinase
MTRHTVSVPATTANLGPGYDSFGLALELRNEFSAELADDWHVEIEGEGVHTLSRDAKNMVALGMAELFSYAGHPELKAHIWCNNRVPLGSGLGSSSAALVGGGALAVAILNEIEPKKRISDETLFTLLARLEGHPDNVAPAVYGGFTVCWEDADDPTTPRAEHFQLVSPLAAVIVPASTPLNTAYARTLIPQDVPHKDAAFNLAHAGLLAAALTSGRTELLHLAIADKLHEPYRAEVIPDYAAVRQILLDAGADAVAVSGAGPTIIAFITGFTHNSAFVKAEGIVEKTTEALTALGTRLTPQAVNFAIRGYKPL